MEIEIRGEGELVIRFIDKKGATLMQERLTVSGSPRMKALRVVDLSLRTAKGEAAIAPVLISQSNPDQQVLFDGGAPAKFTQRRCKEIGCAAKIAAEASRGSAPPPVPDDHPSLTDDAAVIARIVQSTR